MFTFVEEEKEKNISARRMNRNPSLPQSRVSSHPIWEGSLHPFSQRSRSSFSFPAPFAENGQSRSTPLLFILFHQTGRRKDLLAEHFSPVKLSAGLKKGIVFRLFSSFSDKSAQFFYILN
ncbi:hypothetical protein CEXT_765881 [Caerostris extrusa]|uniref:Uncharacterized protein n=1 Tax=Caerostris extrusa TaxID=172846 RepID=A0AAV4X9W9_CAEEX|nr:hypothetical protein CEXT_765881 [Caerostris extrusa]